MEAPWGDMLTDSIEVYAFLGNGLDGRSTFAVAASTVAAWVEPVGRLVRNSDGEEVMSDGTVYADSVLIQPKDKIMYGSSRLYVVSISTVRDESGPHHQEIAYTG